MHSSVEPPLDETQTSGQTKAKMNRRLRVYSLLLRPSSKDHDLTSFLKFAAANHSNPNTNVYKGTYYEYLVADKLKAYNFSLIHNGRTGDRGIDLIGHWTLPGHTRKTPREMDVIVQCKASRVGPEVIRGMEGMHNGAPTGWRGEDVFRLLVAMGKTTEKIVEALRMSGRPMGYMQFTKEGKVKQFTWNQAAERVGLMGLATTLKYIEERRTSKDAQGGIKSVLDEIVAVTWKGKIWRPRKPRRKQKG